MKLNEVPTVILVASGKGGVGKTTVSSDIARTAAESGIKTGLVDADISTPNTPEVVGGEDPDIEGQRLATGDALVPPEINGIQIASQGTVLPDDVPILRDGGWRAEVVADYIENVEWDDDTELVVIDSPPGTGEELQVIASIAPPDETFIVTTPHPSSVRDATKTHEFCKQAHLDHGVIVNMAYIPYTDITRHVLDTIDFGEVGFAGSNPEEDIENMLSEHVSDYHLFGYEPGEGVDIPADHVVTLPYTSRYETRSAMLEDVVRNAAQPQEVEA